MARAGLGGAARLVALPNAVAYDVDPAEPDLAAWRHVPNPRRGVNPHKMKTDRQYRGVAAAYEATYLVGDGAPDGVGARRAAHARRSGRGAARLGSLNGQ